MSGCSSGAVLCSEGRSLSEDRSPSICAAMAAVAGVDVLYSTLRAAGVTFGRPPENQSAGARMVGLKDPDGKDPDGNNLNLLQKLWKSPDGNAALPR